MSKLDASTHTLNTSTSKMTYSFCKANRFLPTIRPPCDSYYDMPNYTNRRSTSFGLGNKTNLSVDIQTPPPGSYTQPSDFETSKKRGFSFGFGRDQLTGGPLSEVKHAGETPGPGAYPLSYTLDSPSITFKSRLPDFTVKRRSYVPGPGTYNPPASINALGQYSVSNFANSRAARFSLQKPPNPKRTQSKSPGPGEYQATDHMNRQGKYHNSRYQNALGKSFGKCPRPEMSYKHMQGTPGPANFKPFSQFDTIS